MPRKKYSNVDWKERVNRLCVRRGWTHADAARAIGISRSAISQIVSGKMKCDPHASTIRAIEREEQADPEVRSAYRQVLVRKYGDLYECIINQHLDTFVVHISYGVGRTAELAIWSALRELGREDYGTGE